MASQKTPTTLRGAKRPHKHECPECGVVWPCVMPGRCRTFQYLSCSKCYGPEIERLRASVRLVTAPVGGLEGKSIDHIKLAEEVRLAAGRNEPRPRKSFSVLDFDTLFDKISAERGLPDLLAPEIVSAAREACMRYNEEHI